MKISLLKKLMNLTVCIFVCFCFMGFSMLVKLQEETPVGEPYAQKAQNSSMVLLDRSSSLAVSEKALEARVELEPLKWEQQPEPEEEQQETPEEQQQETPEEEQQNTPEEEQQNTPEEQQETPEEEQQNTPEEEQQNTPEDERQEEPDEASGEKPGTEPDESGKEQNPETEPGQNAGEGAEGDLPVQGETDSGTEEGGDGNNGGEVPVETDRTYFTTSIIDGETVTESAYSFTVVHTGEVQRQELTPYAVKVEVNGETVPQFTGTVLLEDGANEIAVWATYEKKDGGYKTVGKTYTVYLDRGAIAITDTIRLLGNSPVYKSKFEFEAYAALAGETIPLTVTVNGNELTGTEHWYTAQLQEGSNYIELSAAYEGYPSEVLGYEVVYDTDLFTHNLTDQEVRTPEFEFFASLKQGVELSETGRYAVMLNGKAITNDSGSYQITLSPHANTITLKATDEANGISYEQSFTVIYTPQQDQNPPTITTSLDSGNVDFKSKRHLLSVEAYSYKGDRIFATGNNGAGITVTLNGQTVPPASSNTTYDLYFIAGVNQVTVTAQDEEGYYTSKEYEVTCEAVAEGEKIGTATISVEATTVGLGYLIPPTEVDIYEGENAVYPLARLLDANGFQYNYQGSADNGFYLAHLLKGGITNGAAIPEDLAGYLESAGIGYNDYRTNSLGEYDFTGASGWMYQIDGTVPQFSLSECYLQDGQTLRLRFTLAQGRDIGCAGGENFDKEW